MEYTKEGFGAKEQKLINAILDDIIPDFVKAKEALDDGANINAKNEDGNILEQILFYYRYIDERCKYKKQDCNVEKYECDSCEYLKTNPKQIGEYMLDIIKFFINNGFDVGTDEGAYGANCIRALILSTVNEYELIAVKLLLDAGTIDVKDEYGESLLDEIAEHTGKEEFYFDDYDGDISIGMLYDAMYQIVLARNEGRDYSGIEYCERIKGRKISHVYAKKAGNEDVFFTINTKNSYHPNSFNATLYFEFDEGFFASTKYQECWIDKRLPAGVIEDVSDKFSLILGRRVIKIQSYYNSINHKTYPVVNVIFDNGLVLQITSNFAETDEEEYYAAYFSIINKHNSDI